jgi:hypothetical protein
VFRVRDVLIWNWIRYFVALDFGNWSYSFLQWLSKKSFFAYYLMWVGVHQSLKVKVTNSLHIKVFLSVLLVNGKIRIRTNTYGLGTPKNLRSGSGTIYWDSPNRGNDSSTRQM